MAERQTEKSGEVYILKDTHSGLIKIGCTTNTSQRFHTLQQTLPGKAQVLRTIPTATIYGVEKALHQRYRPYRMHGEWFAMPQSYLATFLAEDLAILTSLKPYNLLAAPAWKQQVFTYQKILMERMETLPMFSAAAMIDASTPVGDLDIISQIYTACGILHQTKLIREVHYRPKGQWYREIMYLRNDGTLACLKHLLIDEEERCA